MTTTPKAPKVVSAPRAVIKAMSLAELLGECVPYVAPVQATKAPRAARSSMTAEEKKAARNAAQRLLRSTPEGKAYANAASKKSIALKKARLEAEKAELLAKVEALEALKARDAFEALAGLETPEAPEALETPESTD